MKGFIKGVLFVLSIIVSFVIGGICTLIWLFDELESIADSDLFLRLRIRFTNKVYDVKVKSKGGWNED